MTAIPGGVLAGPTAAQRGAVSVALRSALRRPSVVIAVLWLALVVGSSLLADRLSRFGPLDQDLTQRFLGPGGEHWLGTDELGRDIFARLLHGGGQLLVASLVPLVIAYLIGVPSGLLVGYLGGWSDRVADFVVNVLFSIPALVIVMAAAVITQRNLMLMTVVLGVLVSGGIFRLVRATTQASRNLLYVDAARVSGVRRGTILMRHILPNVSGPLIVQAFLLYSGAFLFLTSLAFLGLGFDPEAPSWGRMVFDASGVMDEHPWLMVPVGLVLIATVAAVNFVGNAILYALPSSARARLLTRKRRSPAIASTEIRNPKPSAAVPRPEYADGTAPASLAADAALRVQDLVAAFPDPNGGLQPVVDGVSFTVARGQTLCLVGESGCGKTMTALAVLGLLPDGGRTSGKAWLGDVELLGLPETELNALRGSRIALISQEPMVALDPCFSVRSQLGQAVRLHEGGSRSATRDRVIELLRQVGIADPASVARSYPHQLSGGMAQRVCIAMALAGQPDVLVADEPTTALDPTIQGEILELLRSLQHDLGLAIVLVTHDLGVVADIGDAAAVMYAGQVVELAPVTELLASPQHPYTQALLDAIPEQVAPGVALPTVPGVVPPPREWPVHCRFAARCSLALETCRQAPVPLLSIDGDRTSRCLRSGELALTTGRAT